MSKSADAFRTIGEVAEELDVPKHVLRFWEGKFPQIRPMKRGGGRRFYRPEDMELLRGIRFLLHAQGYTIKGVQKILREQGIDQVKAAAARASQTASKRARKSDKAEASEQTAAPAAEQRPQSELRTVTPLGGAPRQQRSPSDADERVLAAIKELQICRAMLADLKFPEGAAQVDALQAEVRRRAAGA